MKNKRKRKQNPLFYINQPYINTPDPEMQESFIYKNKQKQIDPDTEEGVKAELLIDESAEENEAEDSDVENQPIKRPFNELSLAEKIKHLKLVPASIAKVRYEFITIDKTYKGYFLSIKNGSLLIHSIGTRKKNITILEEDLTDIKRIGL